VTSSGYGHKAIAIFHMAILDQHSDERIGAYQAMVDMFSSKSVARKCEELLQRGYISKLSSERWDQASLTDKGRQALETSMLSG